MQTTETKERPILFSGELVRKILSGEKTQTRRVMKPQPGKEWYPYYGLTEIHGHNSDGELDPSIVKGHGFCQPDGSEGHVCPYGTPGDRLWVREAFRLPAQYDNTSPSDYLEAPPEPLHGGAVKYESDDTAVPMPSWMEGEWGRKRPSIHMPKVLCRIRLRIEEVRVERVQEISYSDAEAEGMYGKYTQGDLDSGEEWWLGTKYGASTIDQFRVLWDEINESRGYGWDANPFCWCLTFSLIGD